MKSASNEESASRMTRDRATGHVGMDDLRADVRDLGHDLGKLKDDAIDATTGAAEKAMQTVRSGADTAMESAKKVSATTTDWVRERPMTSVLIAVGVGAILARFMSRR